MPLKHPDIADLRVDLTEAGEVYSALAGSATFDELDLPEQATYDAVVHFAAVSARADEVRELFRRSAARDATG